MISKGKIHVHKLDGTTWRVEFCGVVIGHVNSPGEFIDRPYVGIASAEKLNAPTNDPVEYGKWLYNRSFETLEQAIFDVKKRTFPEEYHQ